MITIGMSSWVGKEEIKKFLLPTLHNGDKICDMGPGWGVYRDLLGHQFEWTGVEIWPETVKALTNNYNHVYECNIKDFNYPEDYDLVIFGDVLEHLSVEDAQECVRNSSKMS